MLANDFAKTAITISSDLIFNMFNEVERFD